MVLSCDTGKLKERLLEVDFTDDDLLELYLLDRFGPEQLANRTTIYGPEFSRKVEDHMKVLLMNRNNEVNLAVNGNRCIICDPVTRTCENGLPNNMVYSNPSTIDKVGLRSGSYVISHLLEAVDSFVNEHGQLPV